MKYFLLTYDPITDHVEVEPFEDDESAFAELKRATLAKNPTDEVVLFYTDSIETLKRTHSRYFYTMREMIDMTLSNLSVLSKPPA